MPAAIWSGALSFGLINVPVKIVSAVREKDVKFHQVHIPDGGRIRYKRVCEVDGEEVKPEDIGKASDEGGAAVLVTTEELDAIASDKTDLLEITDFVKLADVDPIWFEKAYYLVPGKGGDKAYKLLADAMTSQERAAVARVVLRGKERLALVRPMGGALALEMLNWSDEVTMPEDLGTLPKDVKVGAREKDMAEQLIEQLSTDFDPTKYKDEHRERVLDLLQTKREGGILMPVPKQKRETTVDLADALRASLDAARAGKKTHA